MRRTESFELVAAPYTPFNADGSVNLKAIEPYVEALVCQGVSGAFICGTTGEGTSLTTEERMRIASRWVEVAGAGFKVIVHVGHNSIEDARALANHAVQVGAAAIAAMPPSFIRPTTIDDLVAYCQTVAAAGAPLPFYYYHIPSMTGVSLPMIDLLKRGEASIPTLRGIKFTENNLLAYRQCLSFSGERYRMYWGADELLLPAMSLGAQCAVGSTYNYAATNYNTMVQAYDSGDIDGARECTDRSLAIVDCLLRWGVIRTGKAIMAMVGVDCGPPRLPLCPLSSDEKRELKRSVEALGLARLIATAHAS